MPANGVVIGAQALLSLLQLTRSILEQVDLQELVDGEDLTPEAKAELKANLLAERDAQRAEWDRLAPPTT